MKLRSIFLGIFSIFFLISILHAEDNQHFKYSAKPSKLKVKKGEEFTILLDLNVDKGWHIYNLKSKADENKIGPVFTEIAVLPDSIVKLTGKIKYSQPKSKFDKMFEMKIGTYYGNASFLLTVKALTNLDLNKNRILVNLYVGQCTETSCLPGLEFNIQPGKEIFSEKDTALKFSETVKTDTTKATVAPENQIQNNNANTNSAPPPAAKIDKQQLTEDQQNIKNVKSRGIWAYILFAMAHGAAALLTPCVFPMIPITVSFFTKRNEKRKGKGLADSLVYAIGIISTFTAIGIIFTAIAGPSGIQNLASNFWLNLGIAAIFIIFSLNLFGAFEIQIPTGILNALNTKSQGNGMASVLLMGLTFSLTSFTCTVPFVGNTLVSVGDGDWFYPIIGMLAFSMVFAAPFFLLALFPTAMNKLPRAGGWMNNIKVVMGFLEIAAAMKFLSNADLAKGWGILPKELFLAIWIACFILIALYILGIYRLPHDSPVDSVGTTRIMFALFFASVVFYLYTGLNDKQLGELDAFLPPYSNGSFAGMAVSNQGNQINEFFWSDDYQASLKKAKDEKKSLFIDFTGYQCTNCRWMEQNMFEKKEVRDLLKKYILVRLYTDRRNDPVNLTNKDFQKKRFNSIDLPLYVIYTPEENLIGTKAFTRDVAEFLDFLKKGIAKN